MRTVETHLWCIPKTTPHGRSYVSAVHLTREEAMQRYGLGATPVEGAMKMRQELDGDEGADVPLTDMAACGPHWREHFERGA
jgi:hypothetical protein